MNDALASDDSILARAAQLHMPRFDADQAPSVRAGALADHILETATVRGEIAQLRLESHVRLRSLLAEWLSASSFRATRGVKANEEMKRQEHPELATQIDGCKWMIARCTEEMDRLGGSDYDAASRAYTLFSGS